jgi:hypothetical protein
LKDLTSKRGRAQARPAPLVAGDSRRDDESLLYSSTRTRELLGNVSLMWLRRRAARDPSFPQRVYVGERVFYRAADVRAWVANLPTAPPPSSLAAGVRGVEMAKQRKKKPEPEPAAAPRPSARKPRPGRLAPAPAAE